MRVERGGVRPHQRVYRAIYRDHHGLPPYVCYFCAQCMDELEHVHHLDKDPSNNAVVNLVAAHAFCHNSAHHTGWHHTEEMRAHLSSVLRERMGEMTPQERSEKFGNSGDTNPFFGRTHTPETREKLRQAALGRPGPKTIHTEETRRHLSEKIKALPRMWCDVCERDWPPSQWGRHLRKYHEGGAW